MHWLYSVIVYWQLSSVKMGVPAMKVIRVQIEKDKLLSIPDVESTFFLALGHVANEINAITKMLYWAANTPAENDAEDHGRFTMMLLLILVLAGKLNESWELFNKSFFGTGLSRDYEPELDRKAATALQSLKSYFGSRNAANQIRNKFAFHYSPKDVGVVLPDIDEPLILYMDRESMPNNLFYFAETLLAQALLQFLEENVAKTSFDDLVKDFFDVSFWFNKVSDDLMDAIIRKSGEEFRVAGPEEVHFKALHDFSDIILPWFTDTSDAVDA
jgi:hypothetical protein